MDDQAAEWLTVGDVVQRLRVSGETVRVWIRQGLLPAAALGGRRAGYRIKAQDLDAFMEARRRKKLRSARRATG